MYLVSCIRILFFSASTPRCAYTTHTTYAFVVSVGVQCMKNCVRRRIKRCCVCIAEEIRAHAKHAALHYSTVEAEYRIVRVFIFTTFFLIFFFFSVGSFVKIIIFRAPFAAARSGEGGTYYV